MTLEGILSGHVAFRLTFLKSGQLVDRDSGIVVRCLHSGGGSTVIGKAGIEHVQFVGLLFVGEVV